MALIAAHMPKRRFIGALPYRGHALHDLRHGLPLLHDHGLSLERRGELALVLHRVADAELLARRRDQWEVRLPAAQHPWGRGHLARGGRAASFMT